jgi:hypothetical protein
MTWSFRALALTIATTLALSSAQAGSWALDSELLFLRLHSAIGAGSDNIFGYDTAARFALSHVRTDNLGARISYFDYDHLGTDSTIGTISLNTYNLDFEIFKRLNLTNLTSVEVSGGIRYNDTEFFYDDPGQPNDFTGLGGVFGIRLGTKVGTGGLLYARAKLAILGGDGQHDGDDEALDPAYDVARDQMEIAFGYQHTYCYRGMLITPQVGCEWQSWRGFGIDPVDEHPDNDLMLGGFTLGLGLNF